VKKRKGPAVVLLFLIFFAACAPQAEPDAVTVQLKWVHQAHFAGFYIALEKGFFADENLDITLIEGGPGIDVIDSVVSGRADFAVTAPNVLFTEVDEGEPLKAIATIFQISPVVFVSMAESGITRPHDFIDKKISILGVQDFEMQLHAMMDFLGIPLGSMDYKDHTYTIDDLTSGAVDVQGYYVTSGLVRLRDAGYHANLIYPGDYGIHLNGDCLIATDATLEEKPDITRRFLRALLKGYTYAIEHEEEAVQATMPYALEDDANLQRSMWSASIPLISTGSRTIGLMDRDAWQATRDTLLDQNLINQPIPLEQVLDFSFIENGLIE